MKGKARKLIAAVIIFLLGVSITGYGIKENREGTKPEPEICIEKNGHKFLWYEEHKLGNGKYFCFGIDTDGDLCILSDSVQNW